MPQTIDWINAPEGTTHFSPWFSVVKWYKEGDSEWFAYYPSGGEWGSSSSCKDKGFIDTLIESPLSGPKPDIEKAILKSSRVLKYQLKIAEEFTLELPSDIQVIRVDSDDGMVYLWGITSGAETKEFSFKASKTGGDLGDLTGYDYIGFGAIYVQMELGLYYFIKGE